MDREVKVSKQFIREAGWVNLITGFICLVGSNFRPILFVGAFIGLALGYILLKSGYKGEN